MRATTRRVVYSSMHTEESANNSMYALKSANRDLGNSTHAPRSAGKKICSSAYAKMRSRVRAHRSTSRSIDCQPVAKMRSSMRAHCNMHTRRWCTIVAVCAMAIILLSGCTARVLLVADPYIQEIYPAAFSRYTIAKTALRQRQRIDMLRVGEEETVVSALTTQLDSAQYDAVVSTPLYATHALRISSDYPDVIFWRIGVPRIEISQNHRALIFDRKEATELLLEYLSAQYQERDDALLFLFNTTNDRDATIMAEFEDSLIAEQLNYELHHFPAPTAAVLQPHIAQINADRYAVVGIFLNEHSHLVYNTIESERAALIGEYITPTRSYYPLTSLSASIEYDYPRGLDAILSAISTDDQSSTIIYDADLIFY